MLPIQIENIKDYTMHEYMKYKTYIVYTYIHNTYTLRFM